MTKTYKHKTLGWIARKEEQAKYKGQYAIFNGGDYAVKEKNDNPSKQPDRVYMMYPELIENSSDREEVVVEKDWVDKLYDDFFDYLDKIGLPNKEMFRATVEQHAPKQKKITEEQFKKVASDNNWGYRSMYMNRLRNLLYDNDLIEDFEY